MYTLAHPWLLALLLLPVLIRIITPAYREARQAIRVPWFQRMAALTGETPAQGSVVVKASLMQRFINIILWALLVLAMAGPQYLEPPVNQVVPTRDMLLLVDLSGSMETRDFTNSKGATVDRLTAVKEVLDEFLTRRQGDRVGLVVFGNAAFVQVPFTQDLEASRILLEETAVRMAGPRTAFGDAIGLGITLFERSDVEDRVMIALTDGNDTSSKVPPFEAAQIAADKNITIHVVGVGDPTATGEEKFDEEALKLVAQTTSGQYFHAADRKQLQTIYTQLDKLSTREVETVSYRPRIDLFHWPLAAFMLLSLLYYAMSMSRRYVQNRAAAT